MLGPRAATVSRSFMPDEKFDILQNGCQKNGIDNNNFVPRKVVDLNDAINFSWVN